MQDDRVNHTVSETIQTLETFSEGEEQQQQLQQMKEVNDESTNGTHTLDSVGLCTLRPCLDVHVFVSIHMC
jgi:hypothetical protein